MAELRSQVLACSRCSHLAASRQSVVFGEGDIHAKILFVGEAPGVEEDLCGKPFATPAGELLTKILTAMGLGRESVFITNLLKCRPDTPGDSTGNRKPRPDEVSTCIPWLDRQIDLVQPRVVVALGASAVEGLLGKGTAGISQLRGSWQNYRGIPLMPTYHPAYLLRNLALSEKRKVWEDMLQVMERAGYPVSTKQRGFFLTKD
jgi:DNA polymerase